MDACKRFWNYVWNKDDSRKAKIRRIYVGNVPQLLDDQPEDGGVPVGRRGRLERTSLQSFQDKESPLPPGGADISGEAQDIVVPVRRQSIMNGETLPKKVRYEFPNNEIVSSRYTLLSFLPHNLYEQFRRIVNFYFLIVAIIQSLADTPVSPVTSIAPLVFVVSVTMVKQGYEDWLRHKADNVFNNRGVKVVRDGHVEEIPSRDIKVGDIVKLEGEEQVPTDLVLVGSSDEFQRCLLNTANLDGETSLRMRYCPAGLPHFKSDLDLINLHMVIECEEPCEDLYRFNGNMLVPPNIKGLRSSLGTIFEHVHEGDLVGASPVSATNTAPSVPTKDKSSISQGSPPPVHGVTPVIPANVSASPTGNLTNNSNSSSHRGNLRARSGSLLGVSDFNMIFLGMENVLMRGTKIKNTDYVYGVVIYTGPDTRLARNSAPTAPKFSTIERTVNKYLYAFIVILTLLVVPATLLSVLVDWMGKPWYLDGLTMDKTFKQYFHAFSSFLILFNYLIPISLYVTMELQKFIGSKFFVWDQDMTTENGDPPLCNTSDLNEELGQIEYLFTDKTGTLTENVMKTRMFSMKNNIYEIHGTPKPTLFLRDSEDQSRTHEIKVGEDEAIVQFCRVLALCHSIQIMPKRRPSVDSTLFVKQKKISAKVRIANSLFPLFPSASHANSNGKKDSGDKAEEPSWEFQGSSPDEKALVETCVDLGVVYEGENEDVLKLNVCGDLEQYKRHMILEFDADRKCMSVIVENKTGDIYIMTKGAETSVIPRCDSGPTEEVNKHVLTFAMMGYRTLVIAQRKISKPELDKFLTRLKAARRLVEHRDEVMREIYRDIESHLEVIGATGVEDQLQEGVLETLHALGAGGIRVWMLTGDKVETGTAVAYACGLLTSFSKQMLVCKYSINDSEGLASKLEEMMEDMIPDDNTVLIIDGESLEVALKTCPLLLRDVSMKAFRVVCCRMTPLQKSQVVKMVKDTPSHPITAAVGDGANDVAMIQEAHIGLGIIGKEGRQAARCADFAIAKFCYLQKAILVHGHWYYIRLSNLANYFFYKNIVFVIPQVLYCFSSGFSTLALFDGIFLMMFNIFYTACPIFVYGLTEQPHSSKELLRQAYLYKSISRNRNMTPWVFVKWLVFAVWHALVCYYFVKTGWSSFYPVSDLSSFGTVVFSAIVAVANVKILLETRHITGWTIFSHFYSYLTYFAFTAIYSEIDLRKVWIDPGQFRSVFFRVQSRPVFWLLMFEITCTAIVPDIIWKSIEGSLGSIVRFLKSIPSCRFVKWCNSKLQKPHNSPPQSEKATEEEES